MKTFVFLVCNTNADFVDIVAANPRDAIATLVALHPGCRYNIINIV